MRWTIRAARILGASLACLTLMTTGSRALDEGEVPAAVEVRPFFFALSVADVEASSAWYERVFGFEVTREADVPERGIRIRLLRREDALLELVEDAAAQSLATAAPEVSRRHLLHGVFKIGLVSDDLERTLDRLDLLAIELRGRAFTEPDGSMRSLQVEDPDGNVIQVFELLGE